MPIKYPQNDAFFSNLVLQRTQEFSRIGGGAALQEWFDTGEQAAICDFLNREDNRHKYLALVEQSYQNEAASLVRTLSHQNVSKVASIGCGNGFLELLLLHQLPIEHLILIDIEESPGNHSHGFQKSGAGYTSLCHTRTFMESNGVDPDRITTCNPTIQALPKSKIDCVISLLSMGFHYPCTS
jgi:hypothetical protein